MNSGNIVANIGINTLRSLLGALVLLALLFPFLNDIYYRILNFDSTPNLYILTLFVIVSGVLGIYIEQVLDRLCFIYLRYHINKREEFNGFPPWEAWMDHLIVQYKRAIFTRLYLIASMSLSLMFLFVYVILNKTFDRNWRNRQIVELKEITIFNSDSGWILIYLVLVLLSTILISILSLLYLSKGRIMGKGENEKRKGFFYWEIENRIQERSMSRYAAPIRFITEMYECLIAYRFYNQSRIVANLKMIAIVRTFRLNEIINRGDEGAFYIDYEELREKHNQIRERRENLKFLHDDLDEFGLGEYDQTREIEYEIDRDHEMLKEYEELTEYEEYKDVREEYRLFYRKIEAIYNEIKEGNLEIARFLCTIAIRDLTIFSIVFIISDKGINNVKVESEQIDSILDELKSLKEDTEESSILEASLMEEKRRRNS